MKAAVLTEPFNYEVTEVTEPEVRPNWLKVRVEKTGICGSEVHAFKGTHPFRKPPIISGHELGGVVTEVGGSVERFKSGDRVTVEPQISCGECTYCEKGNYNLCTSKEVMGTTDDTGKWTGSFGEYVLAPESKTYLIPDNLSFSQASLIEPLAVGEHNLDQVNADESDSLIIFGAGTIGLSTLIDARARGMDEILVTDVKDYNLQMASDLGARYAVNVAEESLEKQAQKAFGKEGADTAIIAVGKAPIFKDALNLTRRDGRIVIVGMMHEKINLDLHEIGATGKEKTVTGSTVYTGKDFDRIITLLDQGDISGTDLDGLITHEMSIEQVQEAHELIVEGDEDCIKIILSY
jgi:L-iditol 2-dehydrogenase